MMTGTDSLIYDAPLPFTIVVITVIIILLYVLGGIASRYYVHAKDPEPVQETRRAANDGVALLGFIFLLLSFTFSISLSRYDTRRQYIYEEANDIGTAILRTDLYPDSAREALRKDFKDYVEARIAYYDAQEQKRNMINGALDRTEEISGKIWARAIRLSKEQPNIIRDAQMIPALNAMIDIVTSRDASRLARVPDAIIYLLLISVFIGSFIVGYDKKSWVVFAFFTIITVATIYIILDLDHPGQGLIRSGITNGKIVDLREMFVSP